MALSADLSQENYPQVITGLHGDVKKTLKSLMCVKFGLLD